jgi:hypothetical protein
MRYQQTRGGIHLFSWLSWGRIARQLSTQRMMVSKILMRLTHPGSGVY